MLAREISDRMLLGGTGFCSPGEMACNQELQSDLEVRWLIPPFSKNVSSSGYVMRIAVSSVDTAVHRTGQSCPLRLSFLEREADRPKVNKIKIDLKVLTPLYSLPRNSIPNLYFFLFWIVPILTN